MRVCAGRTGPNSEFCKPGRNKVGPLTSLVYRVLNILFAQMELCLTSQYITLYTCTMLHFKMQLGFSIFLGRSPLTPYIIYLCLYSSEKVRTLY